MGKMGTQETVVSAGSKAAQPVGEIRELAKIHRTRRAVFAGVCALKGWKPGKQEREEEYLDAVREFGSRPVSGRKEKRGC